MDWQSLIHVDHDLASQNKAAETKREFVNLDRSPTYSLTKIYEHGVLWSLGSGRFQLL